MPRVVAVVPARMMGLETTSVVVVAAGMRRQISLQPLGRRLRLSLAVVEDGMVQQVTKAVMVAIQVAVAAA